MNILTVSRLRAYRKCARLERLTYVEGWRPVVEAEALRFGSLWHLGLEYWWTGGLDTALTAVAGRAVDEYEQTRVEELLRAYDARWQGQDYEVLGVEEEFGVPLINPATWQPSRTWRLAGKVDARVRLADGRVAVVEHKTTSENIEPGSDYWLRLAMDHQLSAYLLGAETLGDSPTACIYDVVLKPALRPLRATPAEARKYTRDGRLYANQRETDETPDDYRLRLREALAAEPERYFQRREIPRTESQLVEFLQDAWAQARSMRDDHLAARAPRNPEACFAYGRCPFFDVCSAGVNPAEHPESFQQLEHVHPELTEEAA